MSDKATSSRASRDPAPTLERQPPSNSSFTDAAEHFLGVAYWLKPADEPLVVGLRKLAKQLDEQYATEKGFNAALYGRWETTWKYLARRDHHYGRPKKPPKDPLESMLEGDSG